MAHSFLSSPYQEQARGYPLDRRLTCTTVIEDSPQDSPQNIMWSRWKGTTPVSASPLSPILDQGGRTPTASHFHITKQSQDFDDLYDMTDTEESEEFPIQFTASPVQEMKLARPRYPSIIIPSPSHWPTVQKLQKQSTSPMAMASPSLLSPMSIKTPSAYSMAKVAAHARQGPGINVPSLDGSMTSEEMSTISCPSTPDLEAAAVHEDDWVAPVTLHSNALETLKSLTGSGSEAEPQYVAIPVAEMQEVGGEAQRISEDLLFTPVDDDDGQLSFLSIPSPGGFFSTLEPGTRGAWTQPPAEIPSTTIAERFYGLPWAGSSTSLSRPVMSTLSSPIMFHSAQPSAPIEQSLYINDDEALTEGPPTARRVPMLSPRYPTTPRQTITPNSEHLHETVYEYKDTYADEVRESGQMNFDRTSSWLAEQYTYTSEDSEDDSSVASELVSETTSEISVSAATSLLATILEETTEEPETLICAQSPPPQKPLPALPEDHATDDTHVSGFRFLNTTSSPKSAFIQRKARTDALRLDRQCLFTSHIDQVAGSFPAPSSTTQAPNTAVQRPFSDLSVITETAEEEENRQHVKDAQRERKILAQIQPVSWNLEATKYLNGGSLLMSPTGRTFSRKRNCRVLDLGGQATCDWAWQVAMDYPGVKVHTVSTRDQQQPDVKIKGPENHRYSVVDNLWTLPFPDNHFHLVSARTLYAHLRAGEYDVVLAECLRVLKPGGCLEFTLLDADILSAGPQAHALSQNFSASLHEAGYDSTPTRSWLPRLRRAGFGDVRRAWLVLPMAQRTLDEHASLTLYDHAENMEGSTRDASFISGMVGSWAWERWMLKLQREMGCEEQALLGGVRESLEEGARTGASWRFLSGYARKPRV